MQIIDISDPASPVIGAGITGLNSPYDITTMSIGAETYALVPSKSNDQVQIINITNPASPIIVASATDGVDGFKELNGANAITTVDIEGKTYAVAASYDDDGVQIFTLFSISSIAVNQEGNSVVLTFSEDITINNALAGDFSISGAETNPVVSSIATSGNTLTLTLTEGIISQDEVISLSYTKTTGGIYDTAGNPLAPLNVSVVNNSNIPDTTPPAVPVINAGGVVNTTITIEGTGDVGSTIELFLGAVSQGATVVDDSGTWEYTSITPINGNNVFTATATDKAKNTSVASPASTIIFDTTSSSSSSPLSSSNFKVLAARPRAIKTLSQGSTYAKLKYSIDITTVVIEGKTYALVASGGIKTVCKLLILLILHHQNQYLYLTLISLVALSR